MTPRHVADVAVARLGLPVPMAKLVTAQALARSIAHGGDAMDALLAWLASREFESECLEALCPLVAMSPVPSAALLARVRSAIPRPSLASDLILAFATGSEILVPSWTGCHRGPAPGLSDLSSAQEDLESATFVPPLFASMLRRLEARMRRPLMRQWAFEFTSILDPDANRPDGFFEHFQDWQREGVGQFVARRGHAARSAYLRTLACAVDKWQLPQTVALQFAEIALPSEPIFLRLNAQSVPVWAEVAHGRTADAAEDPQTLVRDVLTNTEEHLQQRVMHLALTVADDPERRIDLEVFAVARIASEIDPHDAIELCQSLLGEVTPARDGLRALVSPRIKAAGTTDSGCLPLVVPLLGFTIGYMQSDFIGRVPYVPVSASSMPAIELVPGAGEHVLQSGDRTLGRWGWWLRNWAPTHRDGFERPIACCASVETGAAQQLARDVGGELAQVWRLTVRRRESNSSSWLKTQATGLVST